MMSKRNEGRGFWMYLLVLGITGWATIHLVGIFLEGLFA